MWSKKHAGLWEYKTFGDNRYFVFQYLPTLLGMVLLVWLIQIQMAMQRIAPFLAMASMSTRSRSKASFMHLYPTQFLLPNMQYFESHQFIFGACSVAILALSLHNPASGISLQCAIHGRCWGCRMEVAPRPGRRLDNGHALSRFNRLPRVSYLDILSLAKPV